MDGEGEAASWEGAGGSVCRGGSSGMHPEQKGTSGLYSESRILLGLTPSYILSSPLNHKMILLKQRQWWKKIYTERIFNNKLLPICLLAHDL